MDETITQVDEHIKFIDSKIPNASAENRAMLAQAKSTALLAKVIAAGIKEAEDQA